MVIVECMLQNYPLVNEWMLMHHRHDMYEFMVKLLSYNISRTLSVKYKELVASHRCASCWVVKDKVMSRVSCGTQLHLCRTPIDSILLSVSSTLVVRQGTIIPFQPWKHGSGSYTLRYLGWDCACLAGVFDWACSVGLMSFGVLLVLCCWLNLGSRK